jgi:copper(I)-binding protein
MMRVAPILLALLALTGCEPPREIHVSDGYVRLGAVPGRPAAAYFELHGGATDATLISVISDVAIKAEMHESMQSGSMSSMKPIDHIPLPAGKDVIFAPGGKHVMLFDVNPVIKPGGVVPLTLTFADGQRVQYRAGAIAAGDPAPK